MDSLKNSTEFGIVPEPNPEGDDAISALATIFCPNCGYNKKFRNKFLKENIELIVVSMKILDWMSCENCGNMLSLKIEFDV